LRAFGHAQLEPACRRHHRLGGCLHGVIQTHHQAPAAARRRFQPVDRTAGGGWRGGTGRIGKAARRVVDEGGQCIGRARLKDQAALPDAIGRRQGHALSHEECQRVAEALVAGQCGLQQRRRDAKPQLDLSRRGRRRGRCAGVGGGLLRWGGRQWRQDAAQRQAGHGPRKKGALVLHRDSFRNKPACIMPSGAGRMIPPLRNKASGPPRMRRAANADNATARRLRAPQTVIRCPT